MSILSLELRPLIIISISLVASFLIFAFGEKTSPNKREGITITASVIKIFIVFSLVKHIVNGENIKFDIFEIAKGVKFSVGVDPIGLIFASVASVLWLITSIYSIGYMRGHKEKNQTGYYSAFALCLSATMGICFAQNLITFFIFFELLTIATYPLVIHERDEESKKSGRKYLIYTLISGQIFLASIVLIYVNFGTLQFKPGGFIKLGIINNDALLAIFLMMIIAGIVKAGVMPFHSWLPKAMVAPTPVSALLHAVAVVKAGAFATFRIVYFVFGADVVEKIHGGLILTILASCTIILSSLIAIRKDNLKARLAFSTIGQLSYIILGIGLLNPVAFVGAVYHIVAHAFMKITLFMCAGAIFVMTHKKNISEIVGIGKQMPYTMACFAITSTALAGFPFFVGFVSKANIILGAANKGEYIYAVVLLLSALLAICYLFPVILIVFKKDVYNKNFVKYEEAKKSMLIPIIITTFVTILLGIYPNFGFKLYTLAELAANQVF